MALQLFYVRSHSRQEYPHRALMFNKLTRKNNSRRSPSISAEEKIQTRHRSTERNSEASKQHRLVNEKAAVLKSGEFNALACRIRNSKYIMLTIIQIPGSRDSPYSTSERRRHALAIASHTSAPGGRRGIPCSFIRGLESMRHTCEACHNHAEGYTTRATDTRRLGWYWLSQPPRQYAAKAATPYYRLDGETAGVLYINFFLHVRRRDFYLRSVALRCFRRRRYACIV